MAVAVETKVTAPLPPRPRDRYRTATALVAIAAPAALIGIVITLPQPALPAVQHYGPSFLPRSAWSPVTLDLGALPYTFGTVFTSAIGLAVALPVGVSVSLLLAE